MMAGTNTERDRCDKLPADAVVAVIAGGGSLPVDIADRLTSSGRRAVILPIAGEARRDERFSNLPVEPIALEELGDLMARLKRHRVSHLMMAGTVARRPKITAMRPHVGLFRALLDVAWALARGDDKLLRAAINHIEKNGIRVVSAQDVLPELLTDPGAVAGPRISKRDKADIRAATAAARAIGNLDIGQAAVAIGGRVVALEGVEGTDGLLVRTIELRKHGRLAGAKGGVLVKCAKPVQDLRADLPAIGPRTIDDAACAGLAGIALEAGRSLILEREETIRRARAKQVFIHGIEAADR